MANKILRFRLLIFYMQSFFFPSGGHFITKMSFGSTLFSQNYPEVPVVESKVNFFWLFRVLYVYI